MFRFFLQRDNKKKSKQSKEGLSQENEGNDKFEGENNDEEIRKVFCRVVVFLSSSAQIM